VIPDGALAGLRVVELGEFIAVPTCGKLLADLGAEVVKIEPPGGDSARRYGPYPGGRPNPEVSGLFLNLNTSKRSVVLDLEQPQACQRARDLLREADVLIEGLRPGRIAELGFGWAALHELNPGLILVSITSFGQDGPYRDFAAYDITTSAAGGISYSTGAPDREPLPLPLSQGHQFAGLAGAMAALFADNYRRQTGRGQWLDISEAECWATFLAGVGVQPFVAEGRIRRRTGHRAGQRPHLDATLPCKDGYVTIDPPQRRMWERFLELLGNPEWAQDRRFARPLEMTGEYADEVETNLAPWLTSHTKREIFEACRGRRIPAAPVHTIKEVVEHEHLQARGYFVQADHPVAGTHTYPGAPYQFSRTPWHLHSPAPLLGQDDAFTWTKRPEQQSLRTHGATDVSGPAPFRVLDFGWVWAGTVCGQVLADMGAEVIKVESRRRLDGLRLGRVFEVGETIELNPQFHNLNRGKRSITVDMSTAEGADLLRRLAAECDLVIENFAPGVLAKYGLDYEGMQKVNPSVVMISLTAAGSYGPLADILAYAPIVHSLSGMDGLIGYPDGTVVGSKHAYLDVLASLYGAYAALAALRHRSMTGEGQYVDLSEWEVATSQLGEAVLGYSMNGHVPVPRGNRHPTLAPHGNYPCRGEDEWVSIAIRTEEEWRGFCRALGQPQWTADPRFAYREGRVCHAVDLDRCITSWTHEQDSWEVTNRLQKHGVAAFPCLTAEGLFVDPHYSAHGLYQPIEHPVVGVEFLYSSPWRFSETPPRIAAPAPLLGQDNDYVFGELLGISAEDLARLTDAKVVW
jgi:crotonobetainyl-CoA:carnitine CoA-transferase CaiB-like acyl-CoA transferase